MCVAVSLPAVLYFPPGASVYLCVFLHVWRPNLGIGTLWVPKSGAMCVCVCVCSSGDCGKQFKNTFEFS